MDFLCKIKILIQIFFHLLFEYVKLNDVSKYKFPVKASYLRILLRNKATNSRQTLFRVRGITKKFESSEVVFKSHMFMQTN